MLTKNLIQFRQKFHRNRQLLPKKIMKICKILRLFPLQAIFCEQPLQMSQEKAEWKHLETFFRIIKKHFNELYFFSDTMFHRRCQIRFRPALEV